MGFLAPEDQDPEGFFGKPEDRHCVFCGSVVGPEAAYWHSGHYNVFACSSEKCRRKSFAFAMETAVSGWGGLSKGKAEELGEFFLEEARAQFWKALARLHLPSRG